MTHHRLHHPAQLAGAGVATLLLAGQACAGTFGSLAKFDVVNETGEPAWSFEIGIDDSNDDHADTISSVFGYDRVFSFISPDPGAVVRFGKPTIDYIAGFGARIVYGGLIGGISTPSAPSVTSGESCWPGANANWKATSCDHFGISTYGLPAKTTDSWLVDNGSAVLAKQAVGVPAVNFVFTPPPPTPVGEPAPRPAVVQAVIQAPMVAANPRANAFWVKMVKTTVGENIDLGDLLGDNHPGARPEIAALQEAPEVEIEWQVLQIGKVDEVSKSVAMNGDLAAVWRFQFYKYLGSMDDEGIIDPKTNEIPVGNTLNQYVGAFIGQQMAGFNANQLAAVPEPGTWALLLAGLGGVLGLGRRR